MKKTFTVLATCATLLFASCSKEKSIDTTDPDGPGTGGGGSNEAGLLVKTTIQLNQNDSSVTNYGYDAQKRLIRFWQSGNDNVMNEPDEIVILRNGSGVIETFTVNEDPGSASGSTVYTVYNEGGRYTAKVSQQVVAGSTYRDSLVYKYNSAGQVNEEVYYVSIDGSPYADWAKNEFVYSGNGNLTEYKGYFLDVNTMSYAQASHILVEYDNKTNPLVLGAEGILLDQINFVSPNNVTKATVNDLEDPANNEVATYTYVYNDKAKPATAAITFQSVGVPIPVTFHYQ